MANKDVTRKTEGELIDEFITLAFKVTHDIEVSKILPKMIQITKALKGKIPKHSYDVLQLLISSSFCWMSQDKINGPEGLKFAKKAQESNKLRNKFMKRLGTNTTEKTY